MSLLCYLSTKPPKLSDPAGPLSLNSSSSSIEKANAAVTAAREGNSRCLDMMPPIHHCKRRSHVSNSTLSFESFHAVHGRVTGDRTRAKCRVRGHAKFIRHCISDEIFTLCNYRIISPISAGLQYKRISNRSASLRVTEKIVAQSPI